MSVTFSATRLGEHESNPCYTLMDELAPFELNVHNSGAGLLNALMGVEGEDRWIGGRPVGEFRTAALEALRTLGTQDDIRIDGWAMSGEEIQYATERLHKLLTLAMLAPQEAHISWA